MLRRRLALLLALPLAALSMSAATAKRHPMQHTIQPRAAVHYYHPKPAHPTLTLAPRYPQLTHG